MSQATEQVPPASARKFAIAIHVAPCPCILIAVLSAGAAFALPLLVAWLMWFILRERDVWLDDHGRESMNFQITLLVYAVLGILPTLMTCGAGSFVVYPALGALALAGTILAARAASKGRVFRYPVTLRLLKPAM